MADVVILGAGPAGLAAAYELTKNGKRVDIVEKSSTIGGLSKTSEHRGCKFDLGPHIFINRNRRILDFWKLIGDGNISELREDCRQYYNGKVYGSFSDIFLSMPLSKRIPIVVDFLKRRLFPLRHISSYKEQMINDYGERMYYIFNESSQKKFWGVDPSQIERKWAHPMNKKPSFGELSKRILVKWLRRKQVSKQSSRNESANFFHYKYGSGYMYSNLKEMIRKTKRASFNLNESVVRINHDGKKILSVESRDINGNVVKHTASSFISTIPLTVFVERMSPKPPRDILDAAKKLRFRSLIAVNLVVKGNPFHGQWLQVISNDVSAYRITNFCNLSEAMGNEDLCPVAVEYNCFEGDALWKMSDTAIIELAKKEMHAAGLIKKENIVDASVLRMEYAYPVYFLNYEQFVSKIISYLSGLSNLQAVSRSSLYRYNNMGHAVESGLAAADNILGTKSVDTEKLSVLDGKKDI